MKNLLTREEFRDAVFSRDNFACIICGSKKDIAAHHIIERRLWDDGGFYKDNGATLCPEHHIQAEQTILTCDEIRTAAKINTIIIPDTFYNDEKVDKWGNIFLPNGLRVRGELFFDESVQKILESGGVLDKFTKYVKYPKTSHLPWSEGITSDDRVMPYDILKENFTGKEVIVTEKLDGEGSSLYSDYLHARSIDGRNHISRNWLKQFHSTIKNDIPEGWRICGENLYAKHSIYYSNLKSYFMVFAIFDEKNNCLDFSQTQEYCQLIGLEHVPILFNGIYDEDYIRENCFSGKSICGGEQEGYVVRLASGIPFSKYKSGIVKYVRKNHVQTVHNWMHQAIVKNLLNKNS